MRLTNKEIIRVGGVDMELLLIFNFDECHQRTYYWYNGKIYMDYETGFGFSTEKWSNRYWKDDLEAPIEQIIADIQFCLIEPSLRKITNKGFEIFKSLSYLNSDIEKFLKMVSS